MCIAARAERSILDELGEGLGRPHPRKPAPAAPRQPRAGDEAGYAVTASAPLKTRLDVRPEEGMLLAFPPDLLHEVSRVTRGERFAAVSWYV